MTWTRPRSRLAGALTDLPANNLVLDGEVIVQGETGVADFDALQADLASGRSERMVYFAFDLLYLDGFDLRNAPLIERKRILAALLAEVRSECFHLAQHLEVAPALVLEQACAMGLEGIVCKLRDAPFRSGTRANWLKIKCFKQGVFPIVGFIPARGAIAALHLARREGKALAYAGRAGTGFTQKSARELRQVLDALATDRPPMKGAPPRPKSIWVRPELAAAIEYTALTPLAPRLVQGAAAEPRQTRALLTSRVSRRRRRRSTDDLIAGEATVAALELRRPPCTFFRERCARECPGEPQSQTGEPEAGERVRAQCASSSG